MSNRLFLASLAAALGLWSTAHPAVAQALVPHVVQLDSAKLERQGLALAQEAAQIAQFQQYQLAVPRAELATQLAPKSPEVWSLLGGLYLQPEVNEIDKGIAALKQSLTLDNKNPAVLFALGSAHFQKMDYAAAANYLSAGLKLKPNVPGALFDLGNAYFMQRRYSDAIAQYEKAVGQDKQFWPAINNIGLIKYETGNIEDALRQWRSAVAIDKQAAEPLLAIAVALYVKGDREQALKMGEAAVKIDSRYGDLGYLKENLWGDRLLADTKKFLATPRMQATIAQAQQERPTRSPRIAPQ